MSTCEFEKFDAGVRKILSVSREELKAREAKWKADKLERSATRLKAAAEKKHTVFMERLGKKLAKEMGPVHVKDSAALVEAVGHAEAIKVARAAWKQNGFWSKRACSIKGLREKFNEIRNELTHPDSKNGSKPNPRNAGCAGDHEDIARKTAEFVQRQQDQRRRDRESVPD